MIYHLKTDCSVDCSQIQELQETSLNTFFCFDNKSLGTTLHMFFKTVLYPPWHISNYIQTVDPWAAYENVR